MAKTAKTSFYPVLVQKNFSPLRGENVFFPDFEEARKTPPTFSDLGGG
jgi:hypothetical protein